jgi:hypothetical protein
MTSSVHSPEGTIAIGRKHLLDQRLRIDRHKDFIGKLERDGQAQGIAEARRVLCEMEQTLVRMQADIRRQSFLHPPGNPHRAATRRTPINQCHDNQCQEKRSKTVPRST